MSNFDELLFNPQFNQQSQHQQPEFYDQQNFNPESAPSLNSLISEFEQQNKHSYENELQKVIDKLKNLDGSKQSIISTSDFLMKVSDQQFDKINSVRVSKILEIWNNFFTNTNVTKKLCFINLANDLIHKSRKMSQGHYGFYYQFSLEISQILSENFNDVCQQSYLDDILNQEGLDANINVQEVKKNNMKQIEIVLKSMQDINRVVKYWNKNNIFGEFPHINLQSLNQTLEIKTQIISDYIESNQKEIEQDQDSQKGREATFQDLKVSDENSNCRLLTISDEWLTLSKYLQNMEQNKTLIQEAIEMRDFKLRQGEDAGEDEIYIQSLKDINKQMTLRLVQDNHCIDKIADLGKQENLNFHSIISANKIDTFINQINQIN